MTLRIGSLATGYGGLDMAVQEVFDAELAWVSDTDSGACTILAHRYPDVPNLGDMTAVDWAAVEPVDIITGGTPCQDLSQAGRRAGMRDGTRSNLWVAMREAIAALRPKLVYWENVDGAHSAGADSDLEPCPGCVGDPIGGAVLRALGRVLGDLASLGYDAQWVSLRAADVGAAHGRRRVFIAAHPRGEPCLEWRLTAAGQAAGGRAFGELAGRDRAPVGLLPTPRATRGGSHTETMDLLPTPSAGAFNDGEDPDHWEARRQRVQAATGNGNGMGMPLAIAVQLLGDTPSQRVDSHEWMMGYLDHADTPDSVPGQDLRELREDVQPQAVQRATGRPDALPESSELLPVVRELQEGSHPGRAPLAGQEAPRGDVRGVRDAGGLARPSHRPERGEQQAPEPADALLVMPPETPLAGGPGEANGEQPVGCGCSAWGHFAPAIHRHELALGRVAPSPVEVGPTGKFRLSAFAVEWLMMLPAGHVTDVPGLSRTQQLHALGNGVVPIQGAVALRWLLRWTEVAA